MGAVDPLSFPYSAGVGVVACVWLVLVGRWFGGVACVRVVVGCVVVAEGVLLISGWL